MSETNQNFIDRCVKGEVLLEEIDDFIDSWHEGDSVQDIHEYLGMTEEEYSLWVANPDILPFIVKSRVEGKPLDEILYHFTVENYQTKCYNRSHHLLQGGIMARPKKVIDSVLVQKAKEAIQGFSGHKVGLRLQAIISSASHPTELVAEIFDVERQTIWRWSKQFKEKGIDGLKDLPKGHNPPKLNGQQVEQLKGWVEKGLDAQGKPVFWTLARLAFEVEQEFGVKVSQMAVWRLLKKHGFRLKVPRPSHAKADQKAQEDFKKN